MTRLTLKCLFVFVLMSGLATAAEATLVERAQKGDAAAQLALGWMYEKGDGVPIDSAEATKWYLKAAEQGYDFAQFNLGVKYANGEGVPKDMTEAEKWWRKAAEQGYVHAQFNLGIMYAYGAGVPKDSTEAVKWLRKSAEQGDADAQFYLGNMFDSQFRVDRGGADAAGHSLKQDDAESVKWYRKAAIQGQIDAQYHLGLKYSFGVGVLKDDIEALAWLGIAAASGKVSAAVARGTLERQAGQVASLAAQQRSKEILTEIEATKRASTSPKPKDSAASVSPVAETPKASGSGAIVSSAGHVLTAAHVVSGASSVKVFTVQGMKTASVVRIDEANDLAVLKLAAGTYPALPVTPSRRIRLGQSVATIGFPNVEIQGFSPKVTRGEISSLNGIGDDPRAWQISVPVQPGNSGGPLLDENGNLVGVVVSKLGLRAAQATGDMPQNVNYAVKSTYALALLEPYLDSSAPEPNQSAAKPRFEDMVAKAQQSVVLILIY